MKRLLPVIAIAAVAAGCNTNGCLDNQSSIPLAGLYSSATGEQVSINTLQVHGIGAPNDSILITSGTAVQQLYLPMRSTSNVTSWCFHYTQPEISGLENNDTITFEYDSEAYFASEECGAIYRYHIRRYTATTHLIDSVVVTDSTITNVDMMRIKIYLRTAAPEEPAE